jgi:hypothetical protein
MSPWYESDEVLDQETFDMLTFTGFQEIGDRSLEGTTVLVTNSHTYEIDSLRTDRTIVMPEFNSIQIILS